MQQKQLGCAAVAVSLLALLLALNGGFDTNQASSQQQQQQQLVEAKKLVRWETTGRVEKPPAVAPPPQQPSAETPAPPTTTPAPPVPTRELTTVLKPDPEPSSLPECRRATPAQLKIHKHIIDHMRFERGLHGGASTSVDIFTNPTKQLFREEKHKRISKETIVAAVGQSVCKPTGGAPNPVEVTMCVRLGPETSPRQVQEWILWHWIHGVRHIAVATRSYRNAPAYFDRSSFLPFLAAQQEAGAVLEELQTSAAFQDAEFNTACKEAAKAAGSTTAFIVPDTSNFLHLPGEGLSCVADLFRDKPASSALQVPVHDVGNSGETIGNARSELDRTMFGMGSPLNPPWANTALPVALGPNEAAESSVVDPTKARFLRYTQRALAHEILRQAVDCSLAEGESRSFDVNAIHQRFGQFKRHGYTAIRSYDPQLRSLYRILVRGLGYEGVRRERSDVFHHPQRPQSLGGALLKPFIEPQEKATSFTSADLITGAAKVRREQLLHPINGPRTMETIRKEARCWQRSLPADAPNVTFCGYVRNRAKLTAEWVLYHHIMGAAHFRIYDDGSTDGLAETLQPLVDAGLVSIVPAPEPPYRFREYPVAGGLLAAYGDCADAVLQGFDGESRKKQWVGLIDPDEFLVLPSGVCIPEFVQNAQKKNSKAGAVAVPWRDVGHNNEPFDNYMTQFDRTTFAMGAYDQIERVKCFVRADMATGMNTAHQANLQAPFQTVFYDGVAQRGEGWFSGVKENSAVYKNSFVLHYHVRSFASWVQRFLDGFADDDNKVWDFNVDVTYSRWIGGKHTGFPRTGYPFLAFDDCKGLRQDYDLLKRVLTLANSTAASSN